MMFAPLEIATRYDHLAEKFQTTYRWLAETDLVHISPGRYPVCDGVPAIVQDYTTYSAEEALFETHNVHFAVSGKEQLGVCKRKGVLVRVRM